jgi:hypothetical protein
VLLLRDGIKLLGHIVDPGGEAVLIDSLVRVSVAKGIELNVSGRVVDEEARPMVLKRLDEEVLDGVLVEIEVMEADASTGEVGEDGQVDGQIQFLLGIENKLDIVE